MFSRTTRLLAVALFWPLLAGWTWLLVRPNPVPAVVEVVPFAWRFLASKGLHGSVYAALAILGCLWPSSRRGRTAVVGLLFLHGVATEAIQTQVPNRDGRVRDVVVDWTGIAVGLIVLRYFVRNRLTRGPVLPTPLVGWRKNSDPTDCGGSGG